MRYAGGFCLGGSWLTALSPSGTMATSMAPIGENFERPPPQTGKYICGASNHNLYSKIDTRGSRYLGFRRTWWGAQSNLNDGEISLIATISLSAISSTAGNRGIPKVRGTGKQSTPRNRSPPIGVSAPKGRTNHHSPRKRRGWILVLTGVSMRYVLTPDIVFTTFTRP